MTFPTNLESMQNAALWARDLYKKLNRRLFGRALSLAEAEAFIALGRLEQFMADAETIMERVT